MSEEKPAWTRDLKDQLSYHLHPFPIVRVTRRGQDGAIVDERLAQVGHLRTDPMSLKLVDLAFEHTGVTSILFDVRVYELSLGIINLLGGVADVELVGFSDDPQFAGKTWS